MLKKIITIIMASIMLTAIILNYDKNITSTSSRVIEKNLVKVGVLLYRFDDTFTSLVRESLEEIQKENKGKVEFTFFDGKGDQDIQNKSLDTLLQKKEVDLLLLYLVDQGSTKAAINKIKENNIPVVFFGGAEIEPIRSYTKAYLVGSNAEEGGVLQGQILVDAWKANKVNIDKNKDNIMQYIMLEGIRGNTYAIARTKYSVLTINNAGIKTQELASRVCNWNEEEAKDATKALLLKFGDKIEVIIANNDSMAIGAIKALQEQGYNSGDKTKTIQVVGVDGIPEAQDLIKKGIMTGSVIQYPSDTAKALYTVGMNLVYNKNPLEGTEYKFDDTGVLIQIPYYEYISKSN